MLKCRARGHATESHCVWVCHLGSEKSEPPTVVPSDLTAGDRLSSTKPTQSTSRAPSPSLDQLLSLLALLCCSCSSSSLSHAPPPPLSRRRPLGFSLVFRRPVSPPVHSRSGFSATGASLSSRGALDFVPSLVLAVLEAWRSSLLLELFFISVQVRRFLFTVLLFNFFCLAFNYVVRFKCCPLLPA